VVGAKPPFAYERAKTVAATPIPTAALRRRRVCSPFTFTDATSGYSNHVFGGLNRLLVAAFLVGAVLAAPTAAIASGCGGGPSAENVYKECLPSGSGGKSAKHSKSPSSGQPGSSSASTTPVKVSPKAARAIRHAGKDRRYLSSLIHGNHPANLLTSPSRATTTPTAVGSAFDLSSGPTALLIALAGTAVLILGGSGMRVWRNRHRA